MMMMTMVCNDYACVFILTTEDYMCCSKKNLSRERKVCFLYKKNIELLAVQQMEGAQKQCTEKQTTYRQM